MKTAFTKAHLLEPGRYGSRQREIIITDADAIEAPDYIAALIGEIAARVVTIPEKDPQMSMRVVAEILKYLPSAKLSDSGLGRIFEFSFESLEDYRQRFPFLLRGKAGQEGQENEDLPQFIDLSADVDRSINALKNTFNFDAPFTVNLLANQGNDVAEHVDFFGNHTKRRAVRVLSPKGTLTLPGNAIKIGCGRYTISYVFTETPWHGGAGLSIIAGSAPHSAHPSTELRHAYAIDAELRSELA
jgi:hypothetical protein